MGYLEEEQKSQKYKAQKNLDIAKKDEKLKRKNGYNFVKVDKKTYVLRKSTK